MISSRRCAACGAACPPECVFCVQCGEPLSRSCPACDFANPASARYCGHCGAMLADAMPRGSGDERKQVTIVFADVVGSTSMGEGLEPEAYRSILQACLDRLGEQVALFGGTVANLSGDGLLALFGAPVAHEDDPERAVRAALAIQGAAACFAGEAAATHGVPDFKVRVGVSSGLVVVGHMRSGRLAQYTAIGDAVNVAYRLQSGAAAGGILVTESIFRATAARIEYRAVPLLAVRGKRRPLSVFEPLRTREAAPVSPAAWRAPLVGRAAEMRLVRDRIERLARGAGGCVLISGPVGTGKTRLLEEARAATPAGVRWLGAQCASFSGMEPWQVWRQILPTLGIAVPSRSGAASAPGRAARAGLRPSAPTAAGAPEDPASQPLEAGAGSGGPERDAMFAAVRQGLRREARRQPLILALDDMQWADQSSLALLEHLLQHVEGVPVLIIAATRSGIGVSFPRPVAGKPRRWTSPRGARARSAARSRPKPPATFHELTLAPLNPRESQRLLHYLLPHHRDQVVERRLLARAAGNPLYLEELARFMQEASEIGFDRLPATLHMLTAAQVDRLGPGPRQVARVAAVLGGRFDRTLVEAVVGRRVAAAEWAELVAAGIMVDLGREVLAFRQPLTQEAVYDALVRSDRLLYHERAARALTERPLEVPTALFVQHLYASEQWAAAGEAAVKAAEEALAAFAYAEASALCLQALECVERAGLAAPQAAALRCAAQAVRGRLAFISADYAAAVPIFLELAAASREPRRRSHWLIHAARANFYAGRVAEALRQLQNAEASLQGTGDCPEAVEVRSTRIYLLLRLERVAQAAAESEAAVEMALRLENFDEAAAAAIVLGLARFEQGRTRDAVAALQHGLEFAVSGAQPKQRAALLYNLGYVHMHRGEMEQAGECLDRAEAIARQVLRPTTLAFVHVRLAEYHTHRNDWPSAHAAVRRAARFALRTGHAEACASLELAAGRLARDQGRIATALRRLRHARRLAEQGGAVDLLAAILIAQAEALLLAGRTPAARRVLEHAASLVTEERVFLLAQLECAQGMLQRQENDPAAATRTLGRCLARCENAGLLALAARVAWELGLALHAVDPGARDLALQRLAQAEAAFRRLGAPEFAARAASTQGIE
jgi:class 3 adenylate cyclase/tetratricopeptide (TPR) repeat protein